MGNGIFGRMAARRQARISNQFNNNCCNSRVYYCRQPVVHCQPQIVYQQPVVSYSQPRIIQPQTTIRTTNSVLEQTQVPKPPKLELDFNGMQENTVNPNTSLGQWLQNKRESTEVNMFKVGDVHIMEIHGDSPKLQFYDKAGNKWQALSQEQTLKFYQAKEKTNKEESKMGAGNVGSNPTTTQGVINENKPNANAGAGSSSDAGSVAGAGSNSGAGSAAIADSSNGGVTVNNNFNKPDQFATQQRKPSFSYVQKPDGTIHANINPGSGSIIINAGDDVVIGGNNAEGNSVVNSGEIGDGNAVGNNASVNGLSQKDKKLLTSLLNRNNDTTDAAKTEILEALSKAKTTLQKGVNGAKASADTASESSAKAAEQSEATKLAVGEALTEFKKLSTENRKAVQEAIDGFVKEIKGLIEADKVSDNEAIQNLLKQRAKQFKELRNALKDIVPQIATYMDSQTESISADIAKALGEQQKAAPQTAQDPKPAAQDPKTDADAQKADTDNKTSQIAWDNYALVA
jgi:hypothetical protein